ncbi:hypothetical protein PFISCL1PPCAC_23465, partial [Pristionchus fissidentatus]
LQAASMLSVWDEQLWLPGNTTWNDLKNSVYPQREDFLYTLAIGLVMLVVRILIESFVFLPIGWLGGWVEGPLCSRMIAHLCGGFAGRTKFKRVAECAYRFTYYTCAFTAGYFVLRTEPQLTSVVDCWRNWPMHEVSPKVWWYYQIETGFYWGLLFSQLFFDIKRNDFVQMTIHHAITILLLWISWSMNMVRVGTLILFSHDAADILLEVGKLFRYAGWETALAIDFVVFFFLWTGTRLIYYPFYVVRSVIYEAPLYLHEGFSWWNLPQRPIIARVLLVMLCLLVVLHIVWTILILKIAHSFTSKGEVDDIRENESDGEDEDEKKTKK